MLKVFLVEDEFVVREGIKKSIDWKARGYEFCGEASDGELAFPMIQKLKPDIVITDIRMPFMDGLELSRLIKKEMPWIEIIILTGYEEFKYAQEAIRIGVAEYLSKPINSDDLLAEVDSLAGKIREKRQEREIHEKYLMETRENILKERKELFQYLVTGAKSMVELQALAEKLEVDLISIWYNIVLVKIQSMNHAQEEYSDSVVEIEQRLEKIGDGAHLVIFDRNLEGKALLFKGDSPEELAQIQSHYLEEMKRVLAGYGHIRYFGGIGMPVKRLRELPVSFERASHAFAHRYLMKECCILDSADIEQGRYVEQEEFDINNINPKQIERGRVKEFLKFGDRGEVIYFLEEYFRNLGNNALKSNTFRMYIVMDMYFCVVEFVEELQFSRDEIEPFDINSRDMQSRELAMRYLTRIMEKALELRDRAASNRYGDVAAEALKYIDEHYGDEELSLNMLASHMNFSPNHFSMVFSQQTGQTFSKYLTNYRMNKAKELLRCTGKRSSVISMEVGYKDPHYFSYLFKKTQGMTPTQYRGSRPAGGEE